MSTEKLYYQDQYIKEFDASVISCEKDKNNFKVVLDKTAFFPEGGGQPGDRGELIGNCKAIVLDTQIENDIIYHICSNEISGDVHGILNWEKRFDNMQQHTGEQIFTGFVHKAKGYDNVGFHIGEEEVTIDFNGSITKEEIDEFENKANEAVYANIPIEIILPKTEELCKYNYRSKKELTGQVRLVKIGDIDLCACCGTHLKLTGEVGLIKVQWYENYKGGVRIHLKMGKRALKDVRNRTDSSRKICSILSATPANVVDTLENYREKVSADKYAFLELKKKYFATIVDHSGNVIPAVFEDSGISDNARMLADMLAEKEKIAYAFSGNDANGYKYAIISRTENVTEQGKALNSKLNGRGGGRNEMFLGSLNCKKEDIIAFLSKNS